MTKSNWILTGLLILSILGNLFQFKYCGQKEPYPEIVIGDTLSIDTIITIIEPPDTFKTVTVIPKPSVEIFLYCATGSDGDITISIKDDDADNDWYLNGVVSGRLYSSAIIDHAL